MPLRDPQPFYAALERFAALRRAATTDFRWSADGRELSWTVGADHGGQRVWRAGDGVRPTVAAPAHPRAAAAPSARSFMRECYLVPEFPVPEAPSPDGRWFASVQQGELHLRGACGQPDRRLTTGASEALGWDLETVGVDPWSPDSRWLFAAQMDRRAVWQDVRTRFDGADGRVRIDHPRVQRAGQAIDLVQPHLVPIDGGPVRWIDLGEMRDHFLRLVGWLPDASAVVLLRLSRKLDRAELFVVDTVQARARRVHHEQCPTFLRLDPIIWAGPTGCDLLPGRRFVWQSERDGWNHLYLGHLDADPSQPLVQLTRGAMAVHDVIRAGDDGIWFRARADGPRPYDLHVYRVALSGGLAQRLSEGDGEHEGIIAPDGSHFADTFSTPSVAPRSVLRRADGTSLGELELADLRPLLGPAWAPPEEVIFTAADGTTALRGVLYRPPGFDPGRRYPLLHWVYGGPQMRAAPAAFAPRGDNDLLHHALADAGYLVLVLDARGTPQRSKAFQDVVWRSFVAHVVADQAGALRQLTGRHTWIDSQRMGVLGRSWGANFALHLLAAAPELYRAAACTVPGFDPYGGLISEPYLGLPQEEPGPYREAEPWDLPQRLDPRTRVLLMAGTLDSPQQWNLQRMSQRLVEADIAHQTLVFAEQEHVFEGDARHFHLRAIRDFFDEALA